MPSFSFQFTMNKPDPGYAQPTCLVAFSGEVRSDLMRGEPGPRLCDGT